MNVSFFQYKDLLVLPVILFIMYRTAYYIRTKYYKDSEIGKFLLPALTAKIIFTIVLAALVEFLYKGGDLLTYYRHAVMLNDMVLEHPEFTWDLIFKAYIELPTEIQVIFPNNYIYWYPGSTGYIPRIALPFTFLSFGSYWGPAFVFTSFCFVGTWKLFKMFYEVFPHLKNQLAIAILFFPSVCFWCSGILKDTLSFAGFTLFVYSAYMIFIKRKEVFTYVCIGIFSIAVVLITKAYIIFAALPCVFIWVFIEVKSVVKKSQRKIFYAVSYITIPIIIAILYFAIDGSFAAERFASEAVLEEIQLQHERYESIEEQNSYVSIGKYDGTISGIFKMAPASIAVVLFRPFLWESSSVMMILSALESLILTYLTLLVLWRYRFNLLAIIRAFRRNPISIFCILFALIFAIVVGISTSNFGTMSRYRAPGLPFYLIVLFFLLNAKKSKKIVNDNDKLIQHG